MKLFRFLFLYFPYLPDKLHRVQGFFDMHANFLCNFPDNEQV